MTIETDPYQPMSKSSPLRPLCWLHGSRVGACEPKDLADVEGHFFLGAFDGESEYRTRDSLGVHKHFVLLQHGAVVDEDNLLYALLKRHPGEEAGVFSVPARSVLVTKFGEKPLLLPKAPLEFGTERGDFAQRDIRTAMNEIFEKLSFALDGREVWVTLSGGLDSSIIAALAQRHFPDLRAITFRLDDGPISAGDDLVAARRVAEHLRIPLHEVVVSESHALELLDIALADGQDFRDFNVHCALVNAALAEAISSLSSNATVLTGDGANELFADYTPVELQGRTYYDLPRLSRGQLRRHLVRGLDAGDREVGVFARFGVEVVQPYLLCARAFASLPDDYVENRVAKQQFGEFLAKKHLPDFVFERPKVRAQCGRVGETGGTLALLARNRIDQHALLVRFAALLGVSVDFCQRFIRAGVYRIPSPHDEV